MTPIIDFSTGEDFEERRAALEVAEDEDFATLLINSSVDGICALDRHYRYTIWNPTMERMTGLPKAVVIGKQCFETFPFMKDQRFDDAFEQVLSGSRLSKREGFYHVSTGRRGYYESYHSPIYDDRHAIVGILCIVRDITETKTRISELERQVAELSIVLERMKGR